MGFGDFAVTVELFCGSCVGFWFGLDCAIGVVVLLMIACGGL